jgi:mannose-6-phosphate isomerase-like protein (cupin superfamily)
MAGRTLENRRTGERIVIAENSSQAVLEFDLFLQPGGHVPARHVHPRQEERFSVIAGRLRFRMAGRTVIVGPGDIVVVPKGTPHWFGNCGPDVARLHVEVRPALRMRELLQTTMERSSPTTTWKRLADLALLLLDFHQEIGVPNVPATLVTALLTPLAWLRLRLTR